MYNRARENLDNVKWPDVTAGTRKNVNPYCYLMEGYVRLATLSAGYHPADWNLYSQRKAVYIPSDQFCNHNYPREWMDDQKMISLNYSQWWNNIPTFTKNKSCSQQLALLLVRILETLAISLQSCCKLVASLISRSFVFCFVLRSFKPPSSTCIPHTMGPAVFTELT